MLRSGNTRLGAYTLFENTDSSSYNSLQLSAHGWLPKRLQYTFSYAWSHVLDDVSDFFDGMGFFAMPQSEDNLRAEKASANFDVRHRVSASYVWDLPLGGNNPIFGGWSVAGMFFARTGQPFTVNTSFDVNKDGVLSDRLNTMQGIQQVDQGPVSFVLPSGAIKDGISLSFLASPGKDGAVGRNTFRARGVASLDFSLLKKFRLSEQSNIEFRAEAFNLFNRPQFGVPVRILEAPAFGSATATALPARRVQLALKVIF